MQTTPSDLSRNMRIRDWTCLRHSLLWAYEGPVAPSAHVEDVNDSDYSCWLIRQGEVQVTANTRTHTARKGQWIFVPVPSRRQNFTPNAKILSVHFRMKWPNNENVFDQKESLVLRASDHPALERTALTIVRQLRNTFPGISASLPEMPSSLRLYLKVQKLFPMWLDAYAQAQERFGKFPKRLGHLDDRILEALTILDHLPIGEKYDEKSLSRQVALGRSQLNSLFSTSVGATPRHYFEQRKLHVAQDLLRHSRKSIKEISYELGFRYESHFCLWFHRLEHSTPSAFRHK